MSVKIQEELPKAYDYDAVNTEKIFTLTDIFNKADTTGNTLLQDCDNAMKCFL